MNNEELKKKIVEIVLNSEITGIQIRAITGGYSMANSIADAIIEAVIGEVKETKHRAEIMELALDKMAEFVYETSAEQEMWKKEFIKQAEKELAEEAK
jgi:hypothetical protein